MVSHSYFLKIRDSGTHSFALPTLAGVAFVLLDELLHLGGISRTEADGIQDDVPAVALEGPQSIRFNGSTSRKWLSGAQAAERQISFGGIVFADVPDFVAERPCRYDLVDTAYAKHSMMDLHCSTPYFCGGL